MRSVAFFFLKKEVCYLSKADTWLRQNFFYYSNVIRSVIDLKCQVKCERLCGQGLLILQPCSRNLVEQNMSFRAHIQPHGRFELVFYILIGWEVKL